MLENRLNNTRTWVDYLMTFGLWLATAALAVWEIPGVADLVVGIYARYLTATQAVAQVAENFMGSVLGQGTALVMGLFAVVVIIGGFEYHQRRVGQPESLKVLGWTLGIQLILATLVVIFRLI